MTVAYGGRNLGPPVEPQLFYDTGTYSNKFCATWNETMRVISLERGGNSAIADMSLVHRGCLVLAQPSTNCCVRIANHFATRLNFGSRIEWTAGHFALERPSISDPLAVESWKVVGYIGGLFDFGSLVDCAFFEDCYRFLFRKEKLSNRRNVLVRKVNGFLTHWWLNFWNWLGFGGHLDFGSFGVFRRQSTVVTALHYGERSDRGFGTSELEMRLDTAHNGGRINKIGWFLVDILFFVIWQLNMRAQYWYFTLRPDGITIIQNWFINFILF